MIQSEKEIIENSILKIAKELLSDWRERFRKISVYSDTPFVSRNEEGVNYFSEIEINFWQNDGDFVTFTSIVIFMQNEQVLDISDAQTYIHREIESCYEEMVLQHG